MSKGRRKDSTTLLPSAVQSLIADTSTRGAQSGGANDLTQQQQRELDKRFQVKYSKKSLYGRKNDRKQQRVEKKTKRSELAAKRADFKKNRKLGRPAAGAPASAPKTAGKLVKQDSPSSALPLPVKSTPRPVPQVDKKGKAASLKTISADLFDSVDTTRRKLAKVQKSNPALYAMLQSTSVGVETGIGGQFGVAGGGVGAFSAEGLSHLDKDDEDIEYYSRKLGRKGKLLNNSLKKDGLDDLFDDLSEDPKSDLLALRKDRKSSDSKHSSTSVDKNDAIGQPDVASDAVDPVSDDSNDSLLEGLEEEDSEDSEMDFNDLEDDEDSEMNGILEDAEDEEMSDEMPDEGKKQDENGESIQNSLVGKYVPPRLRTKPENHSEKYSRTKRTVQGLLNRLSDSNMEGILGSIEECYRDNSRHDVTEIVTDCFIGFISDHANLLDSFVMTYAALMSCLYNTIGIEFGAHFVQTAVELYKKSMSDAIRLSSAAGNDDPENLPSKRSTNILTLLSHLYNFNIIAAPLVYDFLRECLSRMTELDVEVVLRILRLCGSQIRSDDPSALKEIVALVHKWSSEKQDLSPRVKFMVETIMDLKNNKHKVSLKKAAASGASGSASSLQQEKLAKFISGFLRRRGIPDREPLRVRLEDIEQVETKGKWWLVGSAWAGHGPDGSTVRNSEPETSTTEFGEVSDLLKLAKTQRMSTDIRRNIFVALMSAEDFVDAYEKLMRLGLKSKQEREIVRVLLHCCTNELTYNPYYYLVATKLCAASHGYKITFQYALWDAIRDLESGKSDFDEDAEDSISETKILRRISHLAKMYSTLVAHSFLGLTILKTLDFTALATHPALFCQLFFTHLIVMGDEASVRNVFTKVRKLSECAELCEGIEFFMEHYVVPKGREGRPRMGVPVESLGIRRDGSETLAELLKKRVQLVRSVDEGTPTGTVKQIAGRNTYVTIPAGGATSSTAVIIATDVFGYTLNNPRLMADRFAAQGYQCYVPDLFEGSEPPGELMETFDAFNDKNATISQKLYAVWCLLRYFPYFLLKNSDKKGCTIIGDVISELKTSHGIQKVALMGYCWGGNIGIKLAQTPGVVDVVASAHPGGSLKIPQDIDAISTPIYFALAEVDNQLGPKEIEAIRKSMSSKPDLVSKVDFFDGVAHGFAVRGSRKDPHVNAQRDKAFDETIAFFKRVLE
ncbi:suppressor of glycerol defect [Entophlyctis sp. JEL0112]|nr:suppressor of glycerol defect [Entophlyctis sp. JEL0112]